ncbi:hypothetical protein ABQF33_11665 [Mycolicibacterium sp. XJ2]
MPRVETQEQADFLREHLYAFLDFLAEGACLPGVRLTIPECYEDNVVHNYFAERVR